MGKALLIAALFFTAAAAEQFVIVKTADGLLEGFVDDKNIMNFRGVPYAEPPVGPLRWV